MITDASWSCPTLAGNAAFAAHGAAVHGYEFADPTAPDVNQATSPDFAPEAAHATDVPYLFDLAGKNLLTTPGQRQLGGTMINYWSSFARTGNPTASGAPAWLQLAGPEGPTLQLGPAIHTVDIATEHNCAFWHSVGR